MRTLEQHRDHVLEWVDRDDIEVCIAQIEHAISVSVEALVAADSDPEKIARMKHELELETQILRELEEKRKGIK